MENAYETHWGYFHSAYSRQRMPQAMLLVGPLHCRIDLFAIRLAQLLFCKNPVKKPCYECKDCLMAGHKAHPDMNWLSPEKAGASIKIEHIRELQHSAFLGTQRAPHRVIVIEQTERLNVSSANALLKILEEPPPSVIFLLIAEQMSTVLPTVISRCQVFRFSSHELSDLNNLLAIGSSYSPQSERGQVILRAEALLDGLIAVIEGTANPCFVASQWAQFELGSVLWFLYLTYAQLNAMWYVAAPVKGLASEQLTQLRSLLNPLIIFDQVEKINSYLKKISHNMNINNLLALENLLLDLPQKS